MGRHGWLLVVECTAELPDRRTTGARSGPHGRDGHLQGVHLVGFQVEIGELVLVAVDPIAGLSGVGPAGEDLGVDRHPEFAQGLLVAFERLPACDVGRRILPIERARDLDEAERLGGLEQQREQVGEAFDPISHRRR